VTTDTYDAAGKVVREAAAGEVEALTEEQVKSAMRNFLGEIEQKPPAYSAKKVHGVKFYELARRGEEVPEEPKEVTIYEFEPTSALADGRLSFQLGCSSGTYARALAHDLGNALGVGGHLAELRRIKIGSFHVDDALTLGALTALVAPDAANAGAPIANAKATNVDSGSAAAAAGASTGASVAIAAASAPATSRATATAEASSAAGESASAAETFDERPAPAAPRSLPPGSWLHFDDIPLPFGEVTTDPQQELRITHGQTVLVRELAGDEGDWVKLVNRRRQFIAIGTVVEKIGSAGVGIVQPKVVFR
jgi:tRNA U55 pseudouridine synthase TruB